MTQDTPLGGRFPHPADADLADRRAQVGLWAQALLWGLVIGLGFALAETIDRVRHLESRQELMALTHNLEARQLMAADMAATAPPVLLLDLPLAADPPARPRLATGDFLAVQGD